MPLEALTFSCCSLFLNMCIIFFSFAHTQQIPTASFTGTSRNWAVLLLRPGRPDTPASIPTDWNCITNLPVRSRNSFWWITLKKSIRNWRPSRANRASFFVLKKVAVLCSQIRYKGLNFSSTVLDGDQRQGLILNLSPFFSGSCFSSNQRTKLAWKNGFILCERRTKAQWSCWPTWRARPAKSTGRTWTPITASSHSTTVLWPLEAPTALKANHAARPFAKNIKNTKKKGEEEGRKWWWRKKDEKV